MPDARRITVDQLRRRMDAGEEFTFLDVRNPATWSDSDLMLPGAIRVPVEQLQQHLSRIPKDRPIVTYCTWPNEASSARLAQELQARGYQQVWALQGGLDAWREGMMPVQSKRKAA